MAKTNGVFWRQGTIACGLLVSTMQLWAADETGTALRTSESAAIHIAAKPPPIIDGVEIIGSAVYIHFRSDPFRTYYLRYRDDVRKGEWTTLRMFRQTSIGTHLIAADQYVGIKKRVYRLEATP